MSSGSRAGGLDLDAIAISLDAAERTWGRTHEMVMLGRELLAEVQALRTALRPFAALLHKSMDSRVGGDDAPLYGIGGHAQFTVGDVRRAAALLGISVGTPQP